MWFWLFYRIGWVRKKCKHRRWRKYSAVIDILVEQLQLYKTWTTTHRSVHSYRDIHKSPSDSFAPLPHSGLCVIHAAAAEPADVWWFSWSRATYFLLQMKADDVACDWFVVILWLRGGVGWGWTSCRAHPSPIILKANAYNPVSNQFLRHSKTARPVCALTP